MSRQTTLTGEVLRPSTHRAILFRCKNGSEHWIPRKVCLDGDTIDEGDTEIVVATWFCEKEGLE